MLRNPESVSTAGSGEQKFPAPSVSRAVDLETWILSVVKQFDYSLCGRRRETETHRDSRRDSRRDEIRNTRNVPHVVSIKLTFETRQTP